jgi:hypothetical protein
MRAVNAGQPSAPIRRTPTRSALAARTSLLPGWRLGTGMGILGAEGGAGYLCPTLGAALAAADVIVPLAIALVLLAAILCGDNRTCERVFRLLRWIANRPEPPAPPAPLSDP